MTHDQYVEKLKAENARLVEVLEAVKRRAEKGNETGHYCASRSSLDSIRDQATAALRGAGEGA